MNNNKQQSFTLIELLVVIVIIGILAGVIMISTSSSIDKANFAKAQAFSNTVQEELLLNLVSEWTFDEGDDLTVDRSITLNDARDSWGQSHCKSIVGTVPQIKGGSDCVYGRCVEFFGDGYINCGSDDDLEIHLDNMTLEAWVNISVSKGNTVISKWSPWIFYIPPNNKQTFYIRCLGVTSDTSRSSNSELSLKAWNHVVVTYTKSNYRLNFYLNGKLDGNPAFSNIIEATKGSSFGIGGYGSQISNYMNGKIDDIRIYNAALSSSQIKQNYIAGLNSMLSNGNISNKEYNERINELAYDK